MTMRNWLIAASLAALTPLHASCLERECGEGTIEEDGFCVPATGIPELGNCEAGTHFDTGLMACIPDLPPTECDPDTTEAVVDENGVIQCKGIGGVGDCTTEITCPQPDSGRMTVCGQLYDIASNQPLVGEVGSTARCPVDGSGVGVCKLELKYYDALAFANNPAGTPELATEDDADDGGGGVVTYLDNCGRFKAHNIVPPQLGFLAIGSDDHDRVAEDTYVRGGVAMPAAANVRRTEVSLHATTHDIDQMWTTSAGNPFPNGQTFVERGVYLPIFLHGDTRVPGVKITNAGAVEPLKDYYFSDATEGAITTVDETTPLSETGINGAGLMVDVALSPKSGVGGEPAGCEWPEDLGAAIPGVVFIQERHAVDSSNPDVPCP